MAFKFENLQVWREALELSGMVHEVTMKFPKKELYVLTPQIQKAADSVALNVAEDSTGQSNMEYCRFLRYSIRSAIEVIGCIYLARRRSIITDEDFSAIYTFTNTLVKRLQALRNSIK